MPIFPPVRTLIGFPYEPASVTLVSGSSFDEAQYPLSNLTDGYGRTAWRSLYKTCALRLDLGSNLPVNFIGIVSHNLRHDLLVQVFADTTVGNLGIPSLPIEDEIEDEAYTLLPVLGRAVGVRYPNLWLDTRDAAGNATPARFWQVHITGNDRNITLGEIVIGLADEYEGIIARPWREQLTGWYSRKQLEYGGVVTSGAGTVSRTTELSLVLTPDERAMLDEVYAAVPMGPLDGQRVVVIPDSRRNDLWYVEWPAKREARFDASYREAEQTVALVEETFGVV